MQLDEEKNTKTVYIQSVSVIASILWMCWYAKYVGSTVIVSWKKLEVHSANFGFGRRSRSKLSLV